MNQRFKIYDDGTLDTCVYCVECHSVLRYSEAYRDENGIVTEDFLQMVERDHDDECQMMANIE